MEWSREGSEAFAVQGAPGTPEMRVAFADTNRTYAGGQPQGFPLGKFRFRRGNPCGCPAVLRKS
jgi:hypothetical protein